MAYPVGRSQFEKIVADRAHQLGEDFDMPDLIDERDAVRAPGYQVAYPVGRSQFEKIVADRAHQLGEDFDMPDLIDEILDAGLIPFALLHWELTGLTDEVEELWNVPAK